MENESQKNGAQRIFDPKSIGYLFPKPKRALCFPYEHQWINTNTLYRPSDDSTPMEISYLDLFPTEKIDEKRRLILKTLRSGQKNKLIEKIGLESLSLMFHRKPLKPSSPLVCNYAPLLHLAPFFDCYIQEWNVLATEQDNLALVRMGPTALYSFYEEKNRDCFKENLIGDYHSMEMHGYNINAFYDDVKKRTLLIVLSARTSKELDTLEIKLGLNIS